MSSLANVVCRRGGSLLTTLHKSLAAYKKCGILCYGGGPGAGFGQISPQSPDSYTFDF